jgi:hypothetical protein
MAVCGLTSIGAEQDQRDPMAVIERGASTVSRMIWRDRHGAMAREQLRPWLETGPTLSVGALLCLIAGFSLGRPWAPAGAQAHLRRLAADTGARRRSGAPTSAYPASTSKASTTTNHRHPSMPGQHPCSLRAPASSASGLRCCATRNPLSGRVAYQVRPKQQRAGASMLASMTGAPRSVTGSCSLRGCSIPAIRAPSTSPGAWRRNCRSEPEDA